MVTGRNAFEGKSQAGLISAIMTAEPPAISTLQPLTPPALDHVVRTCLAKDPDARWQTAHDVLVELKWVAEGGAQAVAGTSTARRRRGLLNNDFELLDLFVGEFTVVHGSIFDLMN
jgi:hypothetical protein